MIILSYALFNPESGGNLMSQKQSVQRWSVWFTALFFILLTGIGLYAGLGYGQPWDEPYNPKCICKQYAVLA